jgi:hypothetical protein
MILELQEKTKTSYVPSNASKPTKIKNKQNKSQTKMITDYPQKSLTTRPTPMPRAEGQNRGERRQRKEAEVKER